ncbi:hypothetical protein BCR35DRAFT_334487 [Leucosporidium creatinivorum]|uniref:LYR motif-containing protein Cup1-like N-terminal domain-containing protein n=1 Tax=Leucosporidium creatinivorum TaxID=106004 RepID=A0A1Y2E5Y6_9BASI|nr:hypothetical protein BCR35DRAFT_334487 [Leucosporidium creatinivorum]
MLLGTRLYRALLQESNALQDSRAASYYRQKIRTDFRKDPVPESSKTALKRVSKANKLLRQLQAANDGYLHSLTRVLDTAYARRGPAKHQLLRPLSHPNGRTAPDYSFPAPLSALVTSPLAHYSRPPTRTQLANPPTLPPRADPTSEDARLLGPLIPQRINAVKRRYFNSQLGKLRAPIAIQLKRKDGQPVEDELEMLKQAGLGSFNYASSKSLLEELEAKAQVAEASRPRLPRRLQSPEERATKGSVPPQVKHEVSEDERRILSPSYKNTKWHRPKTITSRLLRRRYQNILANSPILVVEPSDVISPTDTSAPTSQPAPRPSKDPFSFSVAQSAFAKGNTRQLPLASAEDCWWDLQERELGLQGAARSNKGKSHRG